MLIVGFIQTLLFNHRIGLLTKVEKIPHIKKYDNYESSNVPRSSISKSSTWGDKRVVLTAGVAVKLHGTHLLTHVTHSTLAITGFLFETLRDHTTSSK